MRCFSGSVHLDVEFRLSEFLEALNGQQLLVVEGSVCQLVSEDVDVKTLLNERVNSQQPTTTP